MKKVRVHIIICFMYQQSFIRASRGWLRGWTAWNFEYAPQGIKFETHWVQNASWGHWIGVRLLN